MPRRSPDPCRGGSPPSPLASLGARRARALPTLAVAAVAMLLAGACEPAPSYDLLISGGRVVDGTGAPARQADVAVAGDSIAAVGDLSGTSAARVIDASGLVVAPGFIDMHTHSDYTLLADGRALSKATQGVTTEILGESRSAGPVLGEAREEKAETLDRYDVELTWKTLGGYFDTLEARGISVHVASTVAAGQVRASVMGYGDRAPTDAEMKRMRKLVAEAMEQGAIGLSTGLEYTPGRYFTTDQLIELAEPAARRGGVYMTHVRDEGDELLPSLREAARVGREAALPVEVFHFKRYAVRPEGSRLEPTVRDAVALIDSVRDSGVEMAADVYPYAAAQTWLDQRIPEWAHEGGRQRMVERLREPEARARIVEEVRETLSRDRGAYAPETIMLGRTPHEPHRKYLGMRISTIADSMGTSPAETLAELVEKGEGRVRAIYFGMREEDVRYLLGVPWTTVGSDGTAIAPEGTFLDQHPHPRWYGTFPRILGRYVREEGVLELPEAVRKMTSLAASRVGLEDRGTVARGMKADLVAFDPDSIVDRATFTEPHRLSRGVEWLVVNGEVVIDDGEHTGATPGRALRNGGGS